MKSVLLHIFEDDGLDDRLSVALDLCRAHDAHLSCVYITPYSAYVGLDPVGGVFASGAVIDGLRESEARTRDRVEARLNREDVRWDWQSYDGDPAQTIISVSSLADLVVLSQSGRSRLGADAPLPIVDDVAVHAGCPVLVVPKGVTRFDATAPIVIGWNASEEAARAVREALPALRLARAVTLVSIGEEDEVYGKLSSQRRPCRCGVDAGRQAPGCRGNPDRRLWPFAAAANPAGRRDPPAGDAQRHSGSARPLSLDAGRRLIPRLIKGDMI
jgi:nucleotide-binding universal stress UspA family protein